MRSKQDRFVAFLMLIPTCILLGVFVYYFLAKTIYFSISDWGENLSQPALAENVVKNTVGLENYSNLMTDMVQAIFRNSLTNMVFFSFFFVIGSLAFGLLLAIILDQNIFGETIFRTIFLFPMALSFVVTGTIWRWLLQPDGGLNTLPTLFGFPAWDFAWLNSQEIWFQFTWGNVPHYIALLGMLICAFVATRYAMNRNWRSAGFAFAAAIMLILLSLADAWRFIWLDLDAPETETLLAPKGFNAALIGIIIAAVWQMSGYVMALFTAGIRGIPDDLREAARVDGCNEFRLYTDVILPQLRSFMISAIIILGHISLKIFDLVFAMSGADNARTVVPGILVYTKGFRQNSFAQASAVATILLLLITVLIAPYLYLQLRDDD